MNRALMNSNPLREFEEFIENKGIEECYNVFLRKIDTLKSYLYPESLSDSKNGFIDESKNTYLLSGIRPGAENIVHKDGEEFLGSILLTSDRDYEELIYFKDILQAELDKIYRKTIEYINEAYSSYVSEDQVRIQVSLTLDALQYLHEQSHNINSYGLLPTIQTTIEKVIEYINSKYKSYSVSHPVYDLISVYSNSIDSKSRGMTYDSDFSNSTDNRNFNRQRGGIMFGFTGNRTALESLYNILTEIGLFDEYESQLSQFLQIFYYTPSTMVADLQPTIKVCCSNEVAAYTFSKIAKSFSHFNFSDIASSKNILNKKGNPFTRRSLDTAKSKFNGKLINPDKERIDEKIKSLEL
ncbi:MAG: hypothetical protein QM727_12575 [Niabella sp.]